MLGEWSDRRVFPCGAGGGVFLENLGTLLLERLHFSTFYALLNKVAVAVN